MKENIKQLKERVESLGLKYSKDLSKCDYEKLISMTQKINAEKEYWNKHIGEKVWVRDRRKEETWKIGVLAGYNSHLSKPFYVNDTGELCDWGQSYSQAILYEGNENIGTNWYEVKKGTKVWVRDELDTSWTLKEFIKYDVTAVFPFIVRNTYFTAGWDICMLDTPENRDIIAKAKDDIKILKGLHTGQSSPGDNSRKINAIKDLKCGVEIELLSDKIDRTRMKDVLNIFGLEEWKVDYDGSICSNNEDDYTMEVISPIMCRKNIKDLKKTIGLLKAHGGKINATCGLHVHHDIESYNVMNCENLLFLYNRYSEVLKTFINYDRFDNEYCRDVREVYYNYLDGFDGDRVDDLVDWVYENFDRYRAVNFLAYEEHGTVEFRQFNASLNYLDIYSWIELTKAMVEKARVNIELESQPHKYSGTLTLDDMIQELNISDKKVIRHLHSMQNRKAKNRNVVKGLCGGVK